MSDRSVSLVQKEVPSIYRRPGCKTWCIQFRARDGAHVREGTGKTDFWEARQILCARLNEMDNAPRAGSSHGDKVLVGQLSPLLVDQYGSGREVSFDCAARSWSLHLRPFFMDIPVVNITREVLQEYIRGRQEERAKRGAISKELKILKTLIRLGRDTYRYEMPYFDDALENNVGGGFVDQADFRKMGKRAPQLWMRLFLEVGFEYGWRRREILGLRVRHVDMQANLIRRESESKKIGDEQGVVMTPTIRTLVEQAMVGKNAEDFLLTSNGNSRIVKFRRTWWNLCLASGLGHHECRSCGRETTGRRCECGSSKLKYVGVVLQDLTQSAFVRSGRPLRESEHDHCAS